MIKKVARAICRVTHRCDTYDTWDHIGSIDRHVLIEASTAALEALREPTEAMIVVGNEALLECKPVDYIFRAMIATAMEADHD